MFAHMFRVSIGSIIITTLAACLVVIGCSDLQGPHAGGTGSTHSVLAGKAGLKGPLDTELLRALTESSQGEGPTYFMLPRSDELHKIPQDPHNPLTVKKVQLGKLLYHETALGVSNVRPEGRGTYGCASCHFAQAGFMANVPQGIAEGGSGFGLAGEGRTFLAQYDSPAGYPDCQPIRTPSVLNTAYQELMLWNGQFGGIGDNLGTESKWTPGTPLESNFLGLSGLETQAHGGLLAHRMVDVGLSRINGIPRYRQTFRNAFQSDLDPINRLNVALAIAAFERTVLAHEAPFQKWLRGNKTAMSDSQKRGGILFFGKAGCVSCHTGPALSSMTFYALGMNDLDGAYDLTRVNLAPFGGTIPDDKRKGRGGFTGRSDDEYKFKTPQLYNLIDSPFYGHGASFATVREVVEYKKSAIPQNARVPIERLSPQFRSLDLTLQEVDDLVNFLEGALYDDRLSRYLPGALPSGNCFPVNDTQAQLDLDCRPHRAPNVRPPQS